MQWPLSQFGQFNDSTERLLSPMYKLDHVRAADLMGEVARAAEADNWPTASAKMPAVWTVRGSSLYHITRILSYISVPSMGDRIKTNYELAVERRAAAIALAIRLYRFDHASQYPPKLEDLVPDYLPSIPRDAMASDGRPLGYRPNATPPVVYSVGSNGKDDGGVGAFQGRDARWKGSPDAVFPLEIPPQPATLTSGSE